MTPYYKDPDADITIYHGDCLEVMKDFPDKSFDLVLTSPPYNMGKSNLGYQPNSSVGQSFYGENYDDDKNDKEYVDWCMSVINNSLSLSRYVFWNVQFCRSTRGMVFSLQEKFKHFLKDIFIWEKQAVANITAKNGGMAKGWEFVFMFGHDDLTTFNHNDFPDNGYVPNIKTWYKKESRPEHHATFPKELPTYFIQYFTKIDNIILDPFMGSGTTLVAAKELKRRAVGIEISEKYCEIAVKRLKNTIVPMF